MSLKFNPADLPKQMAHLPVTEKGYPVPWFVKDPEDFRVINESKLNVCIIDNVCWICGGKLGKNKAFVTGPLSVDHKVSSEPPSHISCSTFAMKVCPFIALPKTRRREAGLPEELLNLPDDERVKFIETNPEKWALTVVRKYFIKNNLFNYKRIVRREWWSKGAKI